MITDPVWAEITEKRPFLRFSKSFQSVQRMLHQIQLSPAACSYNNSWAVVIVSIIKERAQSAQFHVLEIKEEMRIYNR